MDIKIKMAAACLFLGGAALAAASAGSASKSLRPDLIIQEMVFAPADTNEKNNTGTPTVKTTRDSTTSTPEIDSKTFTNQNCTDADCSNKNVDYLIVTRPLFAGSPELQEFIAWKKSVGFNVGLLTVEWIDKTYNGEHLAAKIKNAIQDTYAGKKTKYALLVGDTQVDLPSDYVDGWYELSQMYNLDQKWNVPTGVFLGGKWMQFADLYYADKDNWPVVDGHLSIQTEDAFFDYEVIVGRFPVRKPSEITNIVSKSKALKPTNHVVSIINNRDIQVDKDPCLAWPVPVPIDSKESLDYYFCFTSMPFAIERALKGQPVSFSNHNLNLNFLEPNEVETARDLIFDSTSIIDGVMHGSHTGNEAFAVSDVPKFKEIFPLYAVGSCLSNTFYLGEGDSLAETMVKSNKGPAVVMGVVNKYQFYKAISEGATVGEAQFTKEKEYRAGMILQDLMGDPSLKITK